MDYESGETCLTCPRKPLNFYRIGSKSGGGVTPHQNVAAVLGRHFWFREHDLQDDIICKVCWEKVSEFHQFYLEVEKLHQHRDPVPLPVFVKEERSVVSEEVIDSESLLLSIEHLETKIKEEDELVVEAVEYIDQTESERDDDYEIEQESDGEKAEEPVKPVKTKTEELVEPRPKRKYTRRRNSASKALIVKGETSSTPAKSGEEREAEDEFIKQHARYVCEECNVEFEQFHVFQRHCMQTHQKEGYITCCGIRHRKRSVLYQHVQHVLNPEAFKCDICGKTYKNRFGYNRHKKESHATEEERAFKCHRCPKSFIRERALEKHLSDHETLDSGSAKCDTCGKCFSNLNILKNHIKYRHVKQMEYICDVCSKGFYMRSTFLTHRKTHELPAEELRKQCPICSKWCKNHDYWKVHVRRHKDEGELSCDVCGHISPNMMALKAHKGRMHSGPRIFPCTFCGKEYARKITLKEHVAAAHTGDVLYRCPHCDRSFHSSANMHSHRKKMHPKEWLEQRMARYGKNGSNSGQCATVAPEVTASISSAK
ncbi:transcription factor grauzone-like [Uranotaenia lowii]|uniref:transcription factor grauzone-like n=1 Tax=Uranotaenia lowii TaxID=190385 RepID=UPI00247972B9|nr:transcription factor grauzone-like [Uranotaenia lowii]